MIVDNKADMGINDFNVRKDRGKVVSYLSLDERPSVGRFLIKNPRNTYDWTVFFRPLWKDAWIGLVTFSFVIPVLIAIIMFVRKA